MHTHFAQSQALHMDGLGHPARCEEAAAAFTAGCISWRSAVSAIRRRKLRNAAPNHPEPSRIHCSLRIFAAATAAESALDQAGPVCRCACICA